MRFTRLATLIIFFLAFGGAADAAKKKKVTLEGVVVERGTQQFLLQDVKGTKTIVHLTPSTLFEEKRSNFLREPLAYGQHQVLRGLRVAVKGHLQPDASLLAKAVRFTQHDLQMARVIDSNLTPIDQHLGALDETGGWIEGQLDELEGFSKQNQSRVQRAQKAAEGANRRVDSLDGRLTKTETRLGDLGNQVGHLGNRISDLDRYGVQESATIYFAAGSFGLSQDAKQALDGLGPVARQPGLIVEVRGFASADGAEDFNRQLSQRRAEAVVRYLIENHQIPPRRLIRAHGYGELEPVADNTTPEGREQNRRAEVRLLLNQGIGQTASR